MTVRPREPVADLLKGTALVLMIQVHIIELFAHPSISGGWLGKASLLLGGPPVAPVFVGLMGYFAGRPKSRTISLLKRAALLLGLGLLLNLGMNAHLFWRIHRGLSTLSPWEFMLGVDILFLAGLGLLMIALLRPLLGRHPGAWLMAAIAIVLLTPTVNQVVVSLTAAAYESPAKMTWLPWVLAYIAGESWWSYFPLFPWLAYPLFGVAVRLWQSGEAESVAARVWDETPWRLHLTTLVFPALVLVITGPWAISVTHNLPDYYHHGARFFLWVFLFLILWTRFHVLADRYFGHTAVARWLKWMGRHVTIVYVWQWLIIGNTATAIYREQDLWQCCLWLAVVLGVSNALTALTVLARSGASRL